VLPAAEGGLPAGTPASLAIRPERVRVRPAASSSQGEGLSGRVESVAYLGQDLILHVRIAGLARPLVARLGAGQESLPEMTEGAAVACEWTKDRARLLTN
jgi:spermidine/putrescine transport system ATP-binding protein/putrescine transport system ATP-binding protein